MHCSANVGDKDDTAIFFVWNRKTTFSRPKKKLVMMNMDGLVKTPF
jgi:ATP-dependent phosphoenolpyruvate carboxykinase